GMAQRGLRFTVITLSTLAILVGALIIISLWFYSVFSFVFIDVIVNNDASIREPYRRNRGLGGSYFAWNIFYIVALGSAALLVARSVYDSLSRLGPFPFFTNIPFGAMVSAVLPHAVIGVSFFITGGLLSFFVKDYVLIIMFKERLGILKAIPKAFKLLASDIGAFMKYMIFKLGLYIVTAVLGSIFSLFAMLFLLLPVGLAALILIFLFKIMPGFLRLPLVMIGVIAGIPLAAFFFFMTQSIFLPFSVFHKTFNIKFLARLDERYDLFTSS
ncbi:MAG: hypothetical protein ABH875_05440, partial [Candidatus Omnitrophota bacterium]